MLESSEAAGQPALGVGERRGGNLTSAEVFRSWHSLAMHALAPIAAAAAALLVQSRQTVAVSESSAGGLISAALLAIPGASAYFQGGGVIYTQNARRPRSLAVVPRGVGEASPLTAHEAPVYRVLEPPRPAALGGEAPLHRNGPPVAEVQQRKEITLGTIGAKDPLRRVGLEVLGEHRTLPHRIDAGLGKSRSCDETRAIARGENLVMTHCLEGRTYLDESFVILHEARPVEERQAPRAGNPDQDVAAHALSILEDEPVRVRLRHR